MANAVVTPVDDQQPEQQGGGIAYYMRLFSRIIILVYVFNFIRYNFFTPSDRPISNDIINTPDASSSPPKISINQQDAPTNPFASLFGNLAIGTPNPIGQQSHVHPVFDRIAQDFPIRNLWRDGSNLQIEVFLSPLSTVSYDDLVSAADTISNEIDDGTPTTPELTTKVFSKVVKYRWDENLAMFGNDPYTHSTTIDLFTVNPHYHAHLTTHNQTLYSHIFMYLHGTSPSKNHPRYTGDNLVYLTDSITRWVFKPFLKERKNLLVSTVASNTTVDNVTTAESPVISTTNTNNTGVTKSYLIPKLTTRLLYDFTAFQPNQLPDMLAPMYKILPYYRGYVPTAYIDHFWTKSDELVLLTNNTKFTSTPPIALNFTIAYAPTSLFRFQMQKQMDTMWKQQEAMGMNDVGQTDKFKEMILETNPWLLALTFVVSLLHTVFELLAFKNDISHWKNLSSGRGLSVYTLFYNAITQLIIFLYLLDNDTSYVVLFSTGAGVLIEIWKISKARDITLSSAYPFIHIDKTTQFNDDDDETDDHDKAAFKYLSYILIPLAFGFAVYSLIYNEFTGWYSFILSTTVSFIYMFGFIPMTAQLFINYRLKSTAHIPIKVFVYKTLNTFVDDLFSFIIKMPWLHRLACLRDDIVFLVLLYQKWIYRIDYTRANEFGQLFDKDGKEIVTEEEYRKAQQYAKKQKEAKKTQIEPQLDKKTESEKTDKFAKKEGNTHKPVQNNDKKINNDDTKTIKQDQKQSDALAPKKLNKWGEEEDFVEEVPDWVYQNQLILQKMRQEEDQRMLNDPEWREKRMREHAEQVETLRQRFGPPRDYDQGILADLKAKYGTNADYDPMEEKKKEEGIDNVD